MKEYSDMDTSKEHNSKEYNEELLNSFVDGELNIRQQTEVKRLMINNSEISRRVQKLQKCKILISSMQKSKAPESILGGVTASLIGKALLAEKSSIPKGRVDQKYLLIRKVFSVAAMLSLVAVLTMVIYIIMAPGNYTGRPVAIDSGQSRNDQAVSRTSNPSFHGRLELKAANLIAVDSFINRAIEDSGMSDSVSPTLDQNMRIYSLNCSKDELDILLFELEGIWNEFDSTKLFVETETFSKPIAVETVNTKQMAEIINQDSQQKIIKMAKDYAFINGISNNMPAKEIVTAMDNTKSGLIFTSFRIPKPLLTGERPTAKKPAGQTDKQNNIHLTIIVNR